MGNLLQDVRFAFRQFRQSPGFVLAAILSLALGIGASTAIFSVVYAILVNPYPYRNNDRMVHVELKDKNGRGPLLIVNRSEAQQLHSASSIEDFFLQSGNTRNLTGADFPVSVNVGTYSSNLFDFMGVPLLLGRGFSSADVPNGAPAPVAVLSYLFWQKQFGGNREILGKSIELDHGLYTVIGVAAPRFTWGDSDVYLPDLPTVDPHDLWNAFIRLKPGVKHETAAGEIQVLLDRFTQSDPKDFRKDMRVSIVTLNQEVLGRFSGTLVLLFGAVMALLLIGCANVSILLLARGTARQHELAVRVSVGAERSRLIQQLLTEAILVSSAGALFGIVAAYFGVGTLSAMVPYYSFPHEAAIQVNAMVLLFCALLALLTGALAGISPAWQLSRPALSQLIQSSSGKHSGSARGRLMHRLLIAGQLALTLLLMTGAGAAIKAFKSLTHTPLGFDPNNVFALDVNFPRGSNPTWQQRMQAQETIRNAIEQTPGVSSASVSTTWFPGFGGFYAKIELQSKPTLADPQAVLTLVSPQILSTLRLPLISGRMFDDAEDMRAAHLALVNQAFVKQYLGDADPIGQHVRSPMLKVEQPNLVSPESPDSWLEVIGVVGDARNDSLIHPVRPAIFLPYSFVLPTDMQILARSGGDPTSVIRSVKQHLREMNPELVAGQDRTLNWWLDTQGWGRERFIATLFSLFAALALILAATGLYSVVSYAVTQRTQEMGIRMSLGAQPSTIIRLVLTSTATTLAAGLVVGFALSLALYRIISSWAGGSSRDLIVLVVSALLLTLVATIACLVPAYRAATIDPMRALRLE
jgi:predicted permease